MSDKNDSYIRIELSQDDYDLVISMAEKSNTKLKERIISTKKSIKKSKKKVLAAKKASQAKSKIAREKVENAIRLLRLEGKTSTRYALAKRAGVAHKTVTNMISEEKMEIINRSINSSIKGDEQ